MTAWAVPAATPAPAAPPADPAPPAAEPPLHHAARYAWAVLLARIDERFPLLCAKCGGEIRIIAFITDRGTVRDCVLPRGEPIAPPTIAPARGPPPWAALDAAVLDPFPSADTFTPPAPAFVFDVRLTW